MSRRPRLFGFRDPRSGEWRELKDPDAPASIWQLSRLNREGRLEIVPANKVEPITMGEAAAAINDDGAKA